MSESGPKLAAIIGWPASHSLSPALHGYWLREYGISGAYVPLSVRPEDFEACVAALGRMEFAGANVTAPHKGAAFALSQGHDEDAIATGAVNTLAFEEGKIRGFNTDVRGFIAALTETFGDGAAKSAPAVILGAGGAARAVAVALSRLGAPEIRVVNRTQARAQSLRKALANIPIEIVEWGKWPRAFAGAGLLVNAASLGLAGQPALEISLDKLPREAVVADIVYNPLETNLLRAAAARGHKTMDGLGMLMHQAVPAFSAWFGVEPKVTPALRAVLEKALTRG